MGIMQEVRRGELQSCSTVKSENTITYYIPFSKCIIVKFGNSFTVLIFDSYLQLIFHTNKQQDSKQLICQIYLVVKGNVNILDAKYLNNIWSFINFEKRTNFDD